MKFLKKIATGQGKDKDQGAVEDNPFILAADKPMPAALSKEELKRASEAVQTWVKETDLHVSELKAVLKSRHRCDSRS